MVNTALTIWSSLSTATRQHQSTTISTNQKRFNISQLSLTVRNTFIQSNINNHHVSDNLQVLFNVISVSVWPAFKCYMLKNKISLKCTNTNALASKVLLSQKSSFAGNTDWSDRVFNESWQFISLMCHVKGWSWSVSIISPVSTDQCLQSHDHDTCVWWILLPQSHVTISVTDHAYHWPITAQLCSTWHCVNQSEPSFESRDLFSTNQSWDGVCCSGSDTWYSVMRQLCLQWPKFNNIDTRWWHQGHSGHGNILMIFGTKYSTCFSDFYKKQKS